MAIIVRSLIFNIAFYLNLLFFLIVAIPAFVLPRRAIIEVAKAWGRSSNWLLSAICNITIEIRGREKIPPGPLLVASKHQSAWETFALLTLFDDPAFIFKRELQWIPLFGWCLIKGRMVPVDRAAGPRAALAMTKRARVTIAGGRQLIIFPEGTRRPAGASPQYKYGVAHLYGKCEVPCLPIALNSGVFWPRRTFLRYPGTLIAECLDPIEPGLSKEKFFGILQARIEDATARLVSEGRQDLAAHGIVSARAEEAVADKT